MKKVFLMMTLVSIGFGATQCTCKTAPQQTQEKKTLVTYFSASGVTKAAAEQLAQIIGADLYQIEPEEAYTEADLDWRDSLSRSSVEMRDLSSRPAIKGTVENLADYDKVYIGFPIWWYTAPTIINTFIEANDLTGKTVVLFATSGGSTIEKSCQDLKEAYPNLTWGEGRLLNDIDEEAIKEWAK